ncbi:MAG: beta-N-acetylhexosaminidase [Burkholderiales bacterium]|jgi:beta-N-acetylhexosaminidase
MKHLPPGRVMVDVAGLELSAHERRRLEQPACAGVILFSRNYEDRTQLRALCEQIKAVREPGLLIAVDQEGGRVQRFRNGFTAIAPMRLIGSIWDRDREQGIRAAHDAAYVIGNELAGCGVDFSFAPVLDIDHGCSAVIGDRSLHSSAEGVIELGRSFAGGLADCGMIAVGKHFPGHGSVGADTHHNIAVDHRTLAQIEQEDLQPFVALCKGVLGGVMPAHVIYDQVDDKPAGFSKFWLQQILRERLGFKGVVFSDDLSMRAASVAGDATERARAALTAGCDIALVCNAPDDADAVLQVLAPVAATPEAGRVLALQRRPVGNTDRTAYESARERLAKLRPEGTNPAA